ncbi:MraY family glycosyltransferase [Pseudomonas sp. R3-41]
MDVYIFFSLIVCGFSAVLTWLLGRYALPRSFIDSPNARSSHETPTPRGGGIAFVFSFIFALPLLAVADLLPWKTAWAMLGAGAAVAILGFLDDHRDISIRWRLFGHFGASVWALYWLGGLPAITMFYLVIDLSWLGNVLAVFYLVWMLNLYNFMDGIDGIACVEAICTCLGASFLYWVCGFDTLIAPPLLLAMAVAGFIYWNFPYAKIFMGDAGSGFLGIMMGLFSVQAAWASSQLLWAWLILLGVFIVDASFTLLRRLLRGDKVYEGHRTHAYQFASRHYGTHPPVTFAVAAINLFWLLPLALSVALWNWDGASVLLLAYTPLLLLAVKFHAGDLEKT